ncbi:MAG: DsbA family protein [Gammaproteobacteria bacterium]
MSLPELKITVFSDYICPFCYIGDARLNRLRELYTLRVNWCFLEIHPDTPAAGMSVSKLGYDDATWQRMMSTLSHMAEEDGLKFREHDFTTNSHASLLLAEAVKRNASEHFYALHDSLFRVLFIDGENIGDPEVLRHIAIDAGISPELVNQAWEDPVYETHLKHYLEAAQELNVRATPTFFIGDGKLRIDGAMPYEDMLKKIRTNESSTS